MKKLLVFFAASCSLFQMLSAGEALTGDHLTRDPDAAAAKRLADQWRAARVNPVFPLPPLAPRNAPLAVSGTCFYVSPNGSDANPGTREKPFATPQRARAAVRARRTNGALPAGGVTVFFAGGTYALSETIALTREDAGTPSAPILWCALSGETPIFEGGFVVKDFAPVTDPAALARLPENARAAVRVADLAAAGYPHAHAAVPPYGYMTGDYGVLMQPDGSLAKTPTVRGAITECYLGDRRLLPARHPNTGWDVFSSGDVNRNTISVSRTDWSRWAAEPDLMITLYPTWLWGDWSVHVAALDPARGTLTLTPHTPDYRLHHYHPNYPYFLHNALAALDAPGEWYIDRTTGRLYLWPPADLPAHATCVLGRVDVPFLTLDGVTDFELRGFVFQHGRGNAIMGRNLTRVTLAGNVVRRFGISGFTLSDSHQVTLRGNVFDMFGNAALLFTGGDRTTLTPADYIVENNLFSRSGRRKRTYAPGINGLGCGMTIRHNHFQDILSSAMRLDGNDFVVASNLVERVVTESDDQGGGESWGNPTFALRFVHNIWRNIGSGGKWTPCGQAGIRLDDAISSTFIYGNRFENCSFGNFGGVQIHGGHNNTVDNNLFTGCPRAISYTPWNSAHWKNFVSRPNILPFFTNAAYTARYPNFATLPTAPAPNRFTRNIVVGQTAPHGSAPAANCVCNVSFSAKPSDAQLAALGFLDPLPPESAIGPREDDPFLRQARVALQVLKTTEK